MLVASLYAAARTSADPSNVATAATMKPMSKLQLTSAADSKLAFRLRRPNPQSTPRRGVIERGRGDLGRIASCLSVLYVAAVCGRGIVTGQLWLRSTCS